MCMCDHEQMCPLTSQTLVAVAPRAMSLKAILDDSKPFGVTVHVESDIDVGGSASPEKYHSQAKT